MVYLLPLSSMAPCCLPTYMHRWSKDGQHGLEPAAPPVSLASPVCSSTLVYEPSDSYPSVRLLSLQIWSALGSPCGASELGNRDLMDTRMFGIAYERK